MKESYERSQSPPWPNKNYNTGSPILIPTRLFPSFHKFLTELDSWNVQFYAVLQQSTEMVMRKMVPKRKSSFGKVVTKLLYKGCHGPEPFLLDTMGSWGQRDHRDKANTNPGFLHYRELERLQKWEQCYIFSSSHRSLFDQNTTEYKDLFFHSYVILWQSWQISTLCLNISYFYCWRMA